MHKSLSDGERVEHCANKRGLITQHWHLLSRFWTDSNNPAGWDLHRHEVVNFLVALHEVEYLSHRRVTSNSSVDKEPVLYQSSLVCQFLPRTSTEQLMNIIVMGSSIHQGFSRLPLQTDFHYYSWAQWWPPYYVSWWVSAHVYLLSFDS